MASIGNGLLHFVRSRSWAETAIRQTMKSIMEAYFDRFSPTGFDIMAEDWDNCIMIDACRFDVFERQNYIRGNLERRRSGGSSTFEVFEDNFLGTTHHDTVYVTANPVPRVDKWCGVDLESVFHDVIDVWEDHWDEKLNTVLPGPVEAAIREAHMDYPNKRILGHFIQPHQPFVGETGQQIDERGMRAYDHATGQEINPGKNVWEQLEDGDIDADLVWKAYEENLDVVLPHIETLCDELPGKTVVTSDHGNMIGEFAWPFPIRQYGHPPKTPTKHLVTVPWLVVGSDQRREVLPETPARSGSSTGEKERLERLEALGYQ